MNIYEDAKVAVTVRQAAERYGLTVGHGGMCRCPFHDDHTPSMKLNDNYFYCFGCQESGDVIDLTAKLLGIGKYEAARELASGIAPVQRKPLFPQSKLEIELRRLRDWKVRYAPVTPEDTLDDRFVEACHRLDYIEYLVELEKEAQKIERHYNFAV